MLADECSVQLNTPARTRRVMFDIPSHWLWFPEAGLTADVSIILKSCQNCGSDS